MAIAAEIRDRISAHEFDLKELSYQIFGTDQIRSEKRENLVEEFAAIAETEIRLLATQYDGFSIYGEDGEVHGYYESLELIARSKVEVLARINAIDSAQEKTDHRRKVAAEALPESEDRN